MPDYQNLIHYQVGDQRLLNPIEAWRTILTTGQAFHLNLFDTVFDQQDWTIEPQISWQHLCRLRAQQLRDRYQWIRLFYSAGRDSHHVAKTFIENNIHIDEMVIVHNRYNIDKDQDIRNIIIPAAKHLLKSSPGTVLTVIELEETDWKQQFRKYFTEHISAGSQGAWVFHPHGLCDLIKRNQHKFHPRSQNLSTGDISGVDKPRVRVSQDWWESYMLDTQFYVNMHDGNMEYFYLTPDLPELHIKQTWMLTNYLNSQADRSIDWINDFSRSFQPDIYDAYCHAIGRGDAVHPKTGLAYDKINRHIRYQTMIDHGRVQKSPEYKNWHDTLIELSSEIPQAFNSGSAFNGTIGILAKTRRLMPYRSAQYAN